MNAINSNNKELKTPVEIRKHSGALFCDRRCDNVFAYHNGV